MADSKHCAVLWECAVGSVVSLRARAGKQGKPTPTWPTWLRMKTLVGNMDGCRQEVRVRGRWAGEDVCMEAGLGTVGVPLAQCQTTCKAPPPAPPPLCECERERERECECESESVSVSVSVSLCVFECACESKCQCQ